MKETDRRWRTKNKKQIQKLWEERERFSEKISRESARFDVRMAECIEQAVQKSKDIFYQREAESLLTSAEFLYEQGKFIRKRWWILQGALLLGLWILLEQLESQVMIERCMGVMASFFAMLLIPELWRNHQEFVPEVEQTSYYTLRQVYAARICLSAIVDFVLICLFFTVAICCGKVAPEEIVIQFFLPYLVTCCICFRTLYSKRKIPEVFAVFLCMVWCIFWTQIILNDKIYTAILPPIWAGILLVAGGYLCVCIRNGQTKWQERWEERWYGIKNF